MHPLEALPRVECARELLRHCAPGSGMIVRSFFLPGYLLFCRFWHPPGTHFSGPKPNLHLLDIFLIMNSSPSYPKRGLCRGNGSCERRSRSLLLHHQFMYSTQVDPSSNTILIPIGLGLVGDLLHSKWASGPKN